MKALKNRKELNELKLDLVTQIFKHTKEISKLVDEIDMEILDDIHHYQYTNLKDWIDCFRKLNKLEQKRLDELADMELEEIEDIE